MSWSTSRNRFTNNIHLPEGRVHHVSLHNTVIAGICSANWLAQQPAWQR
jgi:hypothetical protein